jgi:hypothetical protein
MMRNDKVNMEIKVPNNPNKEIYPKFFIKLLRFNVYPAAAMIGGSIK